MEWAEVVAAGAEVAVGLASVVGLGSAWPLCPPACPSPSLAFGGCGVGVEGILEISRAATSGRHSVAVTWPIGGLEPVKTNDLDDVAAHRKTHEHTVVRLRDVLRTLDLVQKAIEVTRTRLL